MLTMPVAVPSRAGGLKLRAKSKPTIEPGPADGQDQHQHDEQPQRRAARARAAPRSRPSTVVPMMASTSQERRSGCSATNRPKTGPAHIVASTSRVISSPAALGAQPLAGHQEREPPQQREDRAGELRAEVGPQPEPGARVQPGRAQLGQHLGQRRSRSTGGAAPGGASRMADHAPGRQARTPSEAIDR